MKPFLVGLWALIVSLGTSYAVVFLETPRVKQAATEKADVQVQKTRVINVPIISGGAIRGFIVAQFAFTIDGVKAKQGPASPELFLLDEAFRTIYTDDKLDFAHLDKYDVNALTTHLVAATNKRLGIELVRDVLIQDFTFISKEENER